MPCIVYGGPAPAAPSVEDGDECLHKFPAWPSEGHLSPGHDHQRPLVLEYGYGYGGRPLPVQRTSPNDPFLADAFAYNLHLDQFFSLRIVDIVYLPLTSLSF